MQHYEKFWHGSLPEGNNQLLIDYDTFINHFSAEISKHTSLQLNDLQKKYIKEKIDPEDQNQVYKNAYLLFIRDYWSIPSNRTKLFGMKINLKQIQKPKQFDTSINMVAALHIKITYQNNEYGKREEEYVIENDKLINCQQSEEIEMKNKGFMTIGSSQTNEIPIDNIYVNGRHLKIIYTNNIEQPMGGSPSFMKKPKLVTKFFIRDISKSNRIQYVLDNENKYFTLKKGMIISIGLLENLYKIKIDDLNEPDDSKLQHLQTTMNSDRISFVPGIPNRPIKSIINFDVSKVTEAMITDMYDRELYYPDKKKSVSVSKKKDIDETNCFLKFSVQNVKNLSIKKFSDKNLKRINIGRDPSCDVVIDDVSIRPQQCYFQLVNNMWFLRKGEKTQPSVFVSSEGERNSNRMALCEDYAQVFRVKKEMEVRVWVIKPESDDDEF